MPEFIKLINLCKTYHLGEVDVPVLKGVSLRIQSGEMVALMGASGLMTCVYAITKINYSYHIPLFIFATLRGVFASNAPARTFWPSSTMTCAPAGIE